MRLLGVAAVAAILLVACTSESAPTTQLIIDVPDIPEVPGPTTTVDPPEVSTTIPPRDFQTVGSLPDGTPFSVFIETPLPSTVEAISAGVMVEIDGVDRSVGAVSFGQPQGRDDHFFHHGVDLPPGGGIQIDFDDDVLEALGPDYNGIIAGSIRGTINNGFAGLDLDPPFRWATDEEAVMEVRYDDFAVRRGCSALAVACSPTHAVQVIPNEGVLAIASIYGRLGVFVESDVPRPPTGPNYLDPGVLTERISADLMWTGSEVLVWGGKTQRDGLPNLTDGAAFDPVTGTWRQLATFPVQSTLASRAVWAGDRMIVVSSTGTYGYEPGTDEWELLADGHQPPEWRGRMTVVGDTVYMWNASAINALDLTTGVWSVPGDIFTRWPDSWSGSLHNFDDQVLAVWVPDDRCGGKSFAVWEDNDWQQLPVVSLETATFADCSLANQVAALEEDLVIWDNSSQPTKAYSAIDEEWRGVAWIPLGGTEGPSGSVLMGDRFLVPQWGEGAVYDATSELWAKVDLPGHGTSYDMVWTGEEIIAWGISGTFDAWRWTPPEG